MRGNKDSNYEFPENEAHLIHAKIQPGGFDGNTGKRLAQPRTQKFSIEEFRQSQMNRSFTGMEIELLHDPEDEAAVAIAEHPELLGGEREEKLDLTHPLSAERLVYKNLKGEDAPETWSAVKLNFEILALKKEYLAAGIDPETGGVAQNPQDNNGVVTKTPEQVQQQKESVDKIVGATQEQQNSPEIPAITPNAAGTGAQVGVPASNDGAAPANRDGANAVTGTPAPAAPKPATAAPKPAAPAAPAADAKKEENK